MLSIECVLECIVSLGLPAGLREVMVLDMIVLNVEVLVESEDISGHTSNEVSSKWPPAA